MASLIMLRRPLMLGLGLSAAFGSYKLCQLRRSPLLCESGGSPISNTFRTYSSEAKAPVVKKGKLNPASIRQISSGSLLGLLGGLAISTFSRPLTFLIGLMLLGSQYLAYKGYNIIPTARLQRYFSSIDLRSAIEDNVAFKLSFGATFMLAAFAEF